ncbi:MAG TPA: hypothetical protein VGQ49_11255 [Bryobacteraceae bacterium]|jgi:hypothetical protein|nr:hypothetical protein [Bryobacteraceae bacterium]
MTDEKPAPKRRHGTENRQRQKITPIRWEMTEFNKVAAKANRAGLTFGAFMRALGLDGDAGPRSQRIPPIQNETLLRYQGQLGRLNNNVNQIARGINEDEFYSLPELRLALKDYVTMRDAIFVALGKEPSPEMQDWDDLIATSKKALQADPGAETIAIPAALLRRITRGTAAAASTQPDPGAKAVASVKASKRGTVRSNFLPPEGHA